jgi:hypothetical protein
MLRYFLTFDAGTHWNVGNVRCMATKLRCAAGASRKPLAEARCRSVMAYASGDGSSARESIFSSFMVIEPLS